MNDKDKSLFDNGKISDVRMVLNQSSHEKQAETQAITEQETLALDVSTALPYAPEFNLELLKQANTILFGVKNWDDREDVLCHMRLLLNAGRDRREKNVLTMAVGLISAELHRRGEQFYRSKNFPAAEYMYRILDHYGTDLQARVQLAAMIRRGESGADPLCPVDKMLALPVLRKDPVALINQALFIAGTSHLPQKQWMEGIAKALSSLTPTGRDEVSHRWREMAEDGDPEGYLVHLLLLAFRQIETSPLGDKDTLMAKVETAFPQIHNRFFHFVVVDDEGRETECEILFTVEEDGKHYVAYTDNSLDEDGSTRVFANIFDGVRLLPIESEEEWEMIEKILNDVQSELEE